MSKKFKKKALKVMTTQQLKTKLFPKTEFQWNAILPKKDYLYFLDARIYSHTGGFCQYLMGGAVTKYGKTGKIINAYYSCLKSNGDYNSVFTHTRIPKGKVYKIFQSRDALEAELFELLRVEVATGQLGESVYNVEIKRSGLFLSKTPLKDHPDKKNIVKRLYQYRGGKIPTASNASFNDHYEVVIFERPQVVRKPFGKKEALFKERVL